MSQTWNFYKTHLIKMQLLVVAIFLNITLFVNARSYSSLEVDTRLNFYAECVRHDDCPMDYCCVQGMMRYQMPFCFPIGLRDDPCHPYEDNLKENYTLIFPNNKVVHVIESWILLCPCEKNLQCSHINSTCVPLDDSEPDF